MRILHVVPLLLAVLLSAARADEPANGLTTFLLYRGFREGYIINFAEQPFDRRVTPELDLAWGDKSGKKLDDLYPGLKYTAFLDVRWMGSIDPPKTGAYAFRVVAVPGARLMVDGKVLVDAMYGRSAVPYDTPPVDLVAGKRIEVVMEHWSWVGGSVRLMWKEPGQEQFAIIPRKCLVADVPTTQPSAPAITAPEIAPAAGTMASPAFVTLKAPPETYIRYTLDGAEPTRTHGTLYRVPVAITADTTLKARAFSPAGGQSPIAEATYRLPAPTTRPGMKLFRTGNSLTVNAVTYLPRITTSLGWQDTSHAIISAGAPTRYLWEHFGGEDVKDARQNTRKIVKEQAPFDCYITQPFGENNIDHEVDFTSRFYDLVLAHSPKANLYIYMQWSEWRLPASRPAATTQPDAWQASMQRYVKWFEDLRQRLQQKYPDRPVRIIPVGIALLNLQKAIDAGKLPGIKSFAYEMMGDGIHAGQKGCYFLGLVHYATLHRQNPAGAVVADTELTPEQQKIMQTIAWETVQQYPWSGVKDK